MTPTKRQPRRKPEAPVGGLLDPRFKYVRSEQTDIRKTFERIRLEQQKGRAL
jgi:hypothetical protein